VVVGQETHVQATVGDDSMYYPMTGSQQLLTRRNITEWHIRFRAKDAPDSIPRLAIVPPGKQPAVASSTSGNGAIIECAGQGREALPVEPIPVTTGN
jgi:hypothetical protein